MKPRVRKGSSAINFSGGSMAMLSASRRRISSKVERSMAKAFS